MLRVLITLLTSVTLLAACAQTGSQMGESEVRYGTITEIHSASLQGEHQLGLGAIFGGIAGGILGHQIGGGTGQDIATVAGTLAGAFGGNMLQKKYDSPRPGQFIVVKLNNGVSVGITQPADPALRVGDRVRIDGEGPKARVVRI